MDFKSDSKILKVELKAQKKDSFDFCPSCQEEMKKKKLPKSGNLKAISFKQK